jgi:hypothetical protein
MSGETADAVATTAASSDPTPEEIALALERLRSEQNLTRGVLFGSAGAVVGAAGWALITAVTEYQIGWMAVGVGFLVGLGLRHGGKGLDKTFGIMGAGLALLGCLVGNVLACVAFVASAEKVAYLEALSRLNAGIALDLLVATFSPMDLLFYGLAVYEGYKLSIRQVTVEDVRQALGHAHSVPGPR